ncbi:RNA binding motif protein 12Ba [Leuresthes tenuis]|uniref:RNA binding motif protein 12Ba n=1 Tax=Leuresthes tenuis TaxID=355514 RepID=UPI003B502E4C
MTIILRLQGLDVKAGTEDIRTFFNCLHIPDGGVYIVGGRLREAFIAFSNDRDAQLAIRQSGLLLKGSMVTLHISSMAELEQRLQSLLKKKTSALTVGKPQSHSAAEQTLNARSLVDNVANLSSSAAWPIDPDTANLPPSDAQHAHPNSENEPASIAQPLDSSTAFFLGVCTVLQGLTSAHMAVPGVDTPMADSTAALSEVNTPEQTLNSKPGYVSLFGLPASTTKKDICHFFKGLTVQEAIVNVRLGPDYGCLVKFAKVQDAFDALRFHRRSLGSICVKVLEADEKMWTTALQECEQAFNVGVGHKPQQLPLKQSANRRNKSTSMLHLKRPAATQFSFKPKKPKSVAGPNTPSLQTMEYIVMVSNLPKSITKTEIKELFGCPNISHKNILHLLDKAGNTTDTSFLIFNSSEDFDYAMTLSGCHVGSWAIKVSTITKAEMRKMMAKTHPKNQRSRPSDPRLQSHERRSGAETVEVQPSVHQDRAAQTCLFVRNMPASVKKSQIKSLFCKDKLKMEDIVVLHDSEGDGIGEAVIKFDSEKSAAHAQRIHGRDFLGTKVLLTRITLKQMEDILAKVQ